MATRFTLNGLTRFADASNLTLSNAGIAAGVRQTIFTDTIPANCPTIEVAYIFYAESKVTVPALNIPSITFDVVVGTSTLTFVSNAGLISGATNAVLEISGYIVRVDSKTMYMSFHIQQPSAPLTAINLVSSNINQSSTFNNIDFTVPQAVSVGITFSNGLPLNTPTPTTFTRYYMLRSDF